MHTFLFLCAEPTSEYIFMDTGEIFILKFEFSHIT
jgi:hypothetical protein